MTENKDDRPSNDRLPPTDEEVSADDDQPAAVSADDRTVEDQQAIAPHRPVEDIDESGARRASPSRRSILAPIALLLAVIALAASGYLWWQAERADEAREQALASLDDALVQIRTALENQASVLEQLARHDAEVDEAMASRGREIDALGRGLRAAERALEERSGLSSAAREALLHTEIEQYLRMANRAVQLAHDPVTALAALRVADDRLRALDDPALTPVREQVGAEIDALEALPQVDVEGIALRLGRLASRVDDLPLAVRDEDTVTAAGGETGEAPGFWGRTWAAVRGAMKSLVSVRRTDEDAAPMLAPEQEYFLRENLRLQLETARLALLRGDQANFAASLRQAGEWLESYFETDRARIARVTGRLETLAKLELRPELPDLSGSLNALRDVVGGGSEDDPDGQDEQEPI